ncbi:MAG: Peroxisome chaperone and import receptor [Watsoniomyces obsoletus]|nr:MAG: Peroxisome chaperone and import receptor [Watsoniomyces obsoletus]
MIASQAARRAVFLVLTVFIVITAAGDVDHALHRRQNAPVGTGGQPSPSESNSAPPTRSPSSASPNPSSNPGTNTVTSTPTTQPTPSSETTSASASSTPTPSSSPSTSTPSTSQAPSTSSRSTQPAPSTTQSESPSPPPSTATSTQVTARTTSISVSSATQEIQTTIVTVIGASTVSQVRTTSALVPVSTITSTPALGSGDGGSSDDSGMSSGTKKTIIGVVVGIGGAILLGGLAIVAWRVWGRRKAPVVDDDYDDLGSSRPATTAVPVTSTAGVGSSPFKSTLDQYHSTPQPVNTSSNF